MKNDYITPHIESINIGMHKTRKWTKPLIKNSVSAVVGFKANEFKNPGFLMYDGNLIVW